MVLPAWRGVCHLHAPFKDGAGHYTPQSFLFPYTGSYWGRRWQPVGTEMGLLNRAWASRSGRAGSRESCGGGRWDHPWAKVNHPIELHLQNTNPKEKKNSLQWLQSIRPQGEAPLKAGPCHKSMQLVLKFVRHTQIFLTFIIETPFFKHICLLILSSDNLNC